MSLMLACFSVTWANIVQRRVRTLVAITGICFAIFLLFVQLGFLDAARRAATQPFDFFTFDLALVSAEYQFLSSAPNFDRIRLTQLSTTPGISDTFNLNVRNTRWVDPDTEIRSSLLLFGLDQKDRFIADSVIKKELGKLVEDRQILADTFSDSDYGDLSPGKTAEINKKTATIVGAYSLGPFFYADGSAIVRNGGFPRLGNRPSRSVTVGLVQLTPGADLQAVKRDVISQMPDDVIVMTREELIRQEQDYFVKTKPVGLMFHVGAIIAFCVGVVILYQVLSTEVTNRLREYATMKAIGFGSRFVYAQGVIMTIMFAVFSFVPAIVLSLLTFTHVRNISHLPMTMNLPLVSTVIAISAGIAVASGIISLHRVRRADPAELY